MRIAVLSWRDTSHPDGGGSEVFIESVGRELVARGHSVTIVCARYPGASPRESRDGMELVRLGGRLSVYPQALLWLLRHRRSYDVVVDVVNGVPFCTPLVRRRGVVALIHHLHREQWHIIYPGLAGRIGWLVESRLVPRLYRHLRWLTVSDATATELQRLGVSGRRITVARNGLSSTPRSVAKSPTPRLCVLARLVPHKRIEQAFAVVDALASDFPDVHLDVVGDGWWREELVADAARLGITDRVTFHGHVTDSVRDQLLGAAWLMVLPSVKEGWGLAITEAGAQATPTIAYRYAGGTAESVHDGETGVLVDDQDDLLRATRDLLRSPSERERLGGSAKALAESLSWESTTDVVESVLVRVATGDQSP
jgi:glycosyltransferase involved in cell wall biosynthesis